MTQWEYCEIDFDGRTTSVWFYDEAGDYIDHATRHARLGIVLAKLGHDGWELISTWWRSKDQVTYLMKRPCQNNWSQNDRMAAEEKYRKQNPKDSKF